MSTKPNPKYAVFFAVQQDFRIQFLFGFAKNMNLTHFGTNSTENQNVHAL